MESNYTQSVLNNRQESVAHPEVQLSNISVHGNQSSREIRVQAQSHSSTCSSWSFNWPSPTSLIDRTILLRVPVKIRVSGTGNHAVAFGAQGQKFSPSSYPLSRCMRTLTVTVNNQSITVEPHAVFPAWSKLFNGEEFRQMNSYTPAMPDCYNTIQLLGQAHDSPLHVEQYNPSFTEDSRGAFPYEIEANPAGANVYNLHYVFTEPLPHLFLSRFGHEALTRISNMSVQITWTNLNGMFTIAQIQDADGQDATIGPVSFTPNQGELLVRSFNPSVQIPNEVSVGFHHTNVKRFTMASTAGGDVTQADSGQIVYNQVPDKIVIFARQRDEIQDVTEPDAFMSLEKLQVRTEQSIELSGASQRQLYQMRKKNGYNMGWRQWSKRSGSVCVIDVSEDIGGYVPSSMSRFSFNVSATFKNTRYTDFANTAAALQENEMYIVAFFSSKLTTNGTSAFIQGGMTESEVLASLNEGFRTRSEMRESFIFNSDNYTVEQEILASKKFWSERNFG